MGLQMDEKELRPSAAPRGFADFGFIEMWELRL